MSGAIEVERLGGLAGFGGAHLRSRGSLDPAALNPDDRAAVDALFKAKGRGAPSQVRDGFRYRLTRDGKTIEVEESRVPAAIRGVVRDELM